MLTALQVAVALAAAGSVSEDAAAASLPKPTLTISLECPKTEFVLYEDITAVYRITNPGIEPVQAARCTGPPCVQAFVVTGEGSSEEVPQRSPCSAVIFDEHPPGYLAVSEIEVGHAVAFSKPGSYSVRVRLWTGNDPEPSYVESNTVQLTVAQPTGVDAEAIAYFRSLDDFLQLLRRGAGEYCRGRNGPGCFEEINGFLTDHGASAYAPHVTRDLADTVSTGLIDVTPRYDLAIGLFNRFLETWPSHPHASTIMYRLAFVLDEAGRHQEAVAVVQQFDQRFPARPDKSLSLKHHLLGSE